MKIRYFSSQVKQFALSTVVMSTFIIGVAVSNSLDTNYLIHANAKTFNEVKKEKSKVALSKKQKEATVEKAEASVKPKVYDIVN